MPLIFSKQLNVTDITIAKPQVTLLKNPAGEWNYSTIGGSSVEAPKTEAKPAATSAPGAASATPDISVKKLELKDGTITLGATSSQRRSTYDHVNVTASDVSLVSKFPVSVSADLPGGGNLKLDGNVGPVDKTDSTLTPVDAKLQVSSLNLATTGILDPALGLGGIVDVDTTLVNAGGFAQTNGTIKLSKALLVQGGNPAGVPLNVDYSTKYDLRKNSGVLNPSTVKIGSATAHLNGTYASKGEETEVDLKLAGDAMSAKDLEAFLPAIGVNLPKGASLTAGTLSTNLNIKGATNKLVTDGTIGLFNGRLSGFDLGSKMSAISALTGLKTGKDLDIEKMTTNVHMAPTGLRAENFDAIVPSLGSLTGAGTFMIQGTASDPKFVPDVGGLAAGMLKSQLGCAGGSLANVGKTGAQTPADAVKQLGSLFGKKKNP